MNRPYEDDNEQRRQNLARKELAWLRRGAPARTSKPKFRIDAANELIADVPEIRDRVWNMIQDVEQKHETRESGCALIIDVTNLQGGTPKGGVRVQREA